MKGSARARDIEFLFNKIAPNGSQGSEQFVGARFGVKICDASVKVIGSDCVPDNLGLLGDGNTILIVIASVSDEITHVDQALCQG